MRSMRVSQDPSLADKAVLYLRYSSENQTENSIEGQRRECMEFAKKNGLIVLAEYVDRALTGTNDNRPDFQRMIHDSYKKAFGNVIVWKSDRFSRDMLDAVRYERELGKNGVKLLSATEANLDTPEGTLLKSVSLGYNQFYSEELSIKVKRGQRENVPNGKTLGGNVPVGYKVQDNRYVINDKEADIVKETFYLYGELGYSINAIQSKLNSEGKRREDGRALTHSVLEKMLASEKYIGVIKCDGLRNENAMPALVSKELFDLCQKRRNKRKHKNFMMKGKEDYYLSGKVFCKDCGEPYLGESGTSHTGKSYSYYKCHGAKRHRCEAKPIKKDVLEMSVLSILLGLLSDDETGDAIAESIYNKQKSEAPEILTMKKRRAEVEKQIDNFAKAIGMGIITETTKSSLLSLESEKKQLDEAIARASLNCRRFTKEEIRYAVKELSSKDIDNPKSKEVLLGTFVKKIIIDKEGNVTMEFDLFGYEPTMTMGTEDFKKVRINTSLLRQHIKFVPKSDLRGFLFMSDVKYERKFVSINSIPFEPIRMESI